MVSYSTCQPLDPIGRLQRVGSPQLFPVTGALAWELRVRLFAADSFDLLGRVAD